MVKNMVEDIINIIIAVIGIIIAILQFRMDRRAVNEEEKRKFEAKNKEKIMKDIANRTSSLTEMESLVENVRKWSENFSYKEQGLFFSGIQDICINYSKTKEEIQKLYYELVKNESEFSLSYGYARYIDAFRDYISFDSNISELRKDVYNMYNLPKMYAEKQEEGIEIDSTEFFEARRHARDTVELLNVKLSNVIMLVKEIQIKYLDIELS